MLKNGLQKSIKEEISNKIIQEEIKRFEKEITPRIKEYVGKLSFDHIEGFKNYMDLKTEFHIFLHWKDEEVVEGEV